MKEEYEKKLKELFINLPTETVEEEWTLLKNSFCEQQRKHVDYEKRM